MKTWTTPEELSWLSNRIPQWHRRRSEKGVKFLSRTTTEFLELFPSTLPVPKVQKVSTFLPLPRRPLMALDIED